MKRVVIKIVASLMILLGFSFFSLGGTENLPPPQLQPDRMPKETPTQGFEERSEGRHVDPVYRVYRNDYYGFSFKYPADWVFQEGQPTVGETFSGDDGYFSFTVASRAGLTLDEITIQEASHALLPFGPNPQVKSLVIDHRPAQLILPDLSVDPEAYNLSELIIPLSSSRERMRAYLILQISEEQLPAVLESFNLFSPSES